MTFPGRMPAEMSNFHCIPPPSDGATPCGRAFFGKLRCRKPLVHASTDNNKESSATRERGVQMQERRERGESHSSAARGSRSKRVIFRRTIFLMEC